MKTTNQQAPLLLPSQILEQARALLAKPNGWMQRSYGSVDSQTFCSIGAINCVTSGGKSANFNSYGRTAEERRAGLRAVHILQDVALEKSEENVWSIPSWNDKPGRTIKEVLAAFSKAIKKAKAGGE